MNALKIDAEAFLNKPEYEEVFLENRQELIRQALMRNDFMLIEEIIEIDRKNIQFLQEYAKKIKGILDNMGKLRFYL